MLLAIVIALGFKGAQAAGFKSVGEKITIEDSPNDSGATFLVTYVLPLLTDVKATPQKISLSVSHKFLYPDV